MVLWIGIWSTILSHIVAIMTGPLACTNKGYLATGYKEYSSSTRVDKSALAASMLTATKRGLLCSQSAANTELGRCERETDRQTDNSLIWSASLRAPEVLFPTARLS